MGIDEEFANYGLWLSLAVAFVCGTAIGLERQYRGKAVGVRSAILISIGTMLFVYLGSHIEGESVDPSRVLGQVVTGIGFLGAGVMFNNNGVVNGATTASVVWILSAIGAMSGMGYVVSPLILTVFTVSILSGCSLLESRFHFLRKGDYGDNG